MDDRLAARTLALGAILGLVLGGALLLAPATLITLFGYATSPAAELLARLFAAEAIGFSLLGFWLGKDRRIRTAIVRSHLAAEGIGGIASALAIRAGGGNALAWAIPGLFLGFAVIWTYLLVSLPRS